MKHYSFSKEKIRQAIDYIIKEPETDDDTKGHKLPFLCSELLCFENDDILKYFTMNNTELLEENETKENDIALSIEVKAEEKNIKEEKNEKNIDPHIELLDYLLTFLDTKTDLNYVLLGYFSKLLSNIFLRKPLVICYIYAFSHDKIDKLFYHSSKKGICNILNELISLIYPVV